MTKQEWAHIARLMYDLQEYCKDIYQSSWLIDDNHRCYICFANNNGVCKLFIKRYGMPFKWDITKSDIERLERDES